jgi:hypothetical protein
MSEVIAIYVKTSREFKGVERISHKTSLESLIISSWNQIASRLLQINDSRQALSAQRAVSDPRLIRCYRQNSRIESPLQAVSRTIRCHNRRFSMSGFFP